MSGMRERGGRVNSGIVTVLLSEENIQPVVHRWGCPGQQISAVGVLKMVAANTSFSMASGHVSVQLHLIEPLVLKVAQNL